MMQLYTITSFATEILLLTQFFFNLTCHSGFIYRCKMHTM